MRATFKALAIIGIGIGMAHGQPMQQDPPNTAPKQDPTEPIDTVFELPQITLIEKKYPLLSRTPGAATVIEEREIREMAPISGNEVMRRSTGVHVVDEEGAGMRINVGIRGLNPDRSRNVLILEDGIPVALSPYAEPEMYYTPAIDRMESVEILKGSGQILFGPQTIGGVINYITADPPSEATGKLRLKAGDGGFFSAFASYGNTVGNSGYTVNVLHKRAENFGPTKFEITDINLKFKQQIGKKTTLGLKLGYYDEVSNSTYLGLTQTMFDAGGQDFVRMAPFDALPVTRLSISGQVKHNFSNRSNIQVTGFAYSTTRNWLRQDFTENPNASNLSGVVWGDTTIPGGAIYMRNSNGGRNRQFQVAGLETRYNLTYNLFNKTNQLIAGGRVLHEQANEQRTFGNNPQGEGSEIRQREIRTGLATSMFAQNTTILTSRLSVHAGLRFENYAFEREILRDNFGAGIVDTSVVGRDFTISVIPGFGANYNITNRWTFFGGIHRGFAPPRIKDAIELDGQPVELDAELSWNSELGLRGRATPFLDLEFTLFNMNFSNQIIPVSQSSGGAGAGLVNGGATIHRGVELGTVFHVNRLLNTKWDLIWDVNYTFVDARFSDDRTLVSNGEEVNINGNRTPYAPQNLINSGLTFRAPMGVFAKVVYTFVDEQFSNELNVIEATPNGRQGRIDAYRLIDLTVGYDIPKVPVRLHASVKNLTDERFIMTRRPQGIRVNLPRMFFVGVDFDF
ncbi:MAG: TonB-dependent receptor [Schleiferiaceae bacterium]|nr:TonB-dependent receptor [Schleiferiaceae bacterium]